MRYRLMGACIALSLNSFVLANELEIITVSATPIEQSDAGSAVSVISKEDLRERNAVTLHGLFREVPGFAVSQQGSLGSVGQIRVRGAEANQVLVMLNGIEINDPAQGGEFDLSQMSTNDIERIEIIRGPQSALWGSDAMAGVINIITLPQEKHDAFSVGLLGGSFSTSQLTMSATKMMHNGTAKFDATRFESNGTNISREGNEDDGIENLTLGLSGDYSATDTFNLSYTIRFTDKKTEFDDVDYISTGLPTDANFWSNSKYFYSGISLNHELNEKIDQSLSFYRTDTDNTTVTNATTNSIARAKKNAVKYQINYYEKNNTISLLAENETEDFEQRGQVSFFGDPNRDESNRTKSLAIEYRYDNDYLHLSTSARYDGNKDFKDSKSWRVTGAFENLGKTFYGSIGTSVKNPTFSERFGFFTNFIGNPKLKPESSLHWEIGFRTSFSRENIELAITYFNADLTDEIDGFVYDATSSGFTSSNIQGPSDRSGMELEAIYRFLDSWVLKGTYTYLDASQYSAEGKVREVRRPMHSGAISLARKWNKAGINIVTSYTGEQSDDFFPPYPPYQERVKLKAFTLVNASGHIDISDNLLITGTIENLLDERYEQVYGYTSPGIECRLGLRLIW